MAKRESLTVPFGSLQCFGGLVVLVKRDKAHLGRKAQGPFRSYSTIWVLDWTERGLREGTRSTPPPRPTLFHSFEGDEQWEITFLWKENASSLTKSPPFVPFYNQTNAAAMHIYKEGLCFALGLEAEIGKTPKPSNRVTPHHVPRL